MFAAIPAHSVPNEKIGKIAGGKKTANGKPMKKKRKSQTPF